MNGITWTFGDGVSLIYKSDAGCVYDLGSEVAPYLSERDQALATALLRFALKRLEAAA